MENFFIRRQPALLSKLIMGFSLLLILTACGGGGGASPSKPPSSTPNESPKPSSAATSLIISSIDASSETNSSVSDEIVESSVTTSSSSSIMVALPSSSAEQNSSSKSSSIQSSLSITSSSSIISSSASSTSFNGTLSIDISGDKAYFQWPVYLTANVSEGTEWQYQWHLIEDENYQRRDAFGFNWDSSIIDTNCQPARFGSRISGKLYPPRTGLYRFIAAADTAYEFYLSKEGTNKKLMYSDGAVGKSGFFSTPQQQSEWIELQAGQAYPIEFFYIKSNQQGHYSLLWQQPGSSTWEEIPDTAYSKPDELTASGYLQHELVTGTQDNFAQLRAELEKVNSPQTNSARLFNTKMIGITPNSYARHTLEVTATSGEKNLRKQISFYPVDRFFSEDRSLWNMQLDGAAQLRITNASESRPEDLLLQIETTSSARNAEWYTTVHLEPYKAYEVRARVRLLNAPANLPIPSGLNDSTAWKLPRLRVGVHGDASQQGIDPRNPAQWRDIAIDFIVPFHGKVDIHAHMGEYTGKFQVDNLHLVELTNSTVTQFEFTNLSANIYNDIVERTGGYAATQQYFTRIAQAAADMRELSGKYAYAECQKENIFIPRNWSVFALGTNYNNMILKTPDLLTNEFLNNVWASDNIVGGVMVHEIEHSFDFPGSSFDAHLPVLLQSYAMDKRNLLRTADSSFVSVDQWMESEKNRFNGCFSEPAALVPKLFEFQKLLPANQKWSPFKQIMHDRWSPYKIEIEGRSWPSQWGSEYEQYRAWWRELKSYTGLDGWELLHTSAERTQIESMYQRKSSTFTQKDPTNIAAITSGLFLWEAKRKSASVGWGELNTNIVKVDNACNDKSIYAHAPSKITYQLNKHWQTFDTGAFIKDDSVEGLVSARILGDNVELYRSSAFDSRTPVTKTPVLDVSNVNELTLEFLDMGDNNSDWSVWVTPRLLRNTAATALLRPSGKILRHSSGQCLSVNYSAGVEGSPVVLSNDCSTNKEKFLLLASGSILHMGSGRCLIPAGETTNPTDGTGLVLTLTCIDKSASLFDYSSQQQIIQRTSLACVQPGTDTVNEKTVLMLSKQNCSSTNAQFTWE